MKCHKVKVMQKRVNVINKIELSKEFDYFLILILNL